MSCCGCLRIEIYSQAGHAIISFRIYKGTGFQNSCLPYLAFNSWVAIHCPWLLPFNPFGLRNTKYFPSHFSRFPPFQTSFCQEPYGSYFCLTYPSHLPYPYLRYSPGLPPTPCPSPLNSEYKSFCMCDFSPGTMSYYIIYYRVTCRQTSVNAKNSFCQCCLASFSPSSFAKY